jgi:hypothetical protein
MVGGTEETALAGKGQQILVAAIFALRTGKAVVRIATVQIPANDLLQTGPPETIPPWKMIIVCLNKGFEIVLYTAVVIRINDP